MTEQLKAAIEDIAKLNEIDAAELGDEISDIYIAELQRAQIIPERGSLEWHLFFARAQALVVERINVRILDHIAREDALRAAEWEG